MQVRTFAASGVLVGAASLVLGVASPAVALCDSYSTGCPTPPPPAQGGGGTDIGGNEENAGTGTDVDNVGNVDNGGTEGTGQEAGSTGQQPGGGTVNNPATLPFTGGELVLLTALGAGALAGGTALVVAGRRRTSPAA